MKGKMMSNPLVIDLPWPPRELSPNARVHWAKKSTVARRYRRICWSLTLQAMNTAGMTGSSISGPVNFGLEFYPPSRRRMDDDNLVASFKAGRDGISDALQLADSNFRLTIQVMHDEPVKGGLVRVEITQ